MAFTTAFVLQLIKQPSSLDLLDNTLTPVFFLKAISFIKKTQIVPFPQVRIFLFSITSQLWRNLSRKVLSNLWEICKYKKYVQNSDFVSGIFGQIPIARSGILKIPSGTPPGPRASAPASVRRFAPLSGLRSGPRGFFKSPPDSGGSGRKSPQQNQDFLYK